MGELRDKTLQYTLRLSQTRELMGLERIGSETGEAFSSGKECTLVKSVSSPGSLNQGLEKYLQIKKLVISPCLLFFLFVCLWSLTSYEA